MAHTSASGACGPGEGARGEPSCQFPRAAPSLPARGAGKQPGARGSSETHEQSAAGRGWSHLAGCAAAELGQLLPEAGVGVGDGPDGPDSLQHLLAAQLRDGHDVGDDHGGTAGDAGEAGEGKGGRAAVGGAP